MTKTLVVGAAIVNDLAVPTVVLGARRTKPEALRGRWEFPGGKVEIGEQPEEALRRELQEELRIDIYLGAELVNPEGGTWPISDTYEMRLWIATIQTGEPRPTDSHDDFAWIASREIGSYDWLDADVPIGVALARSVLIR